MLTKASTRAKNWYRICLAMQGMQSEYFALQEVMDAQQCNLNFGQEIKNVLQCALALVHDTRITSPGMAFRTLMYMDVPRSVMK